MKNAVRASQPTPSLAPSALEEGSVAFGVYGIRLAGPSLDVEESELFDFGGGYETAQEWLPKLVVQNLPPAGRVSGGRLVVCLAAKAPGPWLEWPIARADSGGLKTAFTKALNSAGTVEVALLDAGEGRPIMIAVSYCAQRRLGLRRAKERIREAKGKAWKHLLDHERPRAEEIAREVYCRLRDRFACAVGEIAKELAPHLKDILRSPPKELDERRSMVHQLNRILYAADLAIKHPRLGCPAILEFTIASRGAGSIRVKPVGGGLSMVIGADDPVELVEYKRRVRSEPERVGR